MSMPENDRPSPRPSNLSGVLGVGDGGQTSPEMFPAEREMPAPQAVEESVVAEGRDLDPNTLGRNLANHFVNKKIHPVCIYGSKGSGKTTFLASMFLYLKHQDAGCSLDLYTDIFPKDDEQWSSMEAGALRVFNRIVNDYVDGSPPAATLDEAPFFIPVKVTPRIGAPVLFAFLEGRGEWYMPTDDQDRPNREFHGLLQGFLQHFSAPLTTIYVAPYTGGQAGQPDSPKSSFMRLSDKGLYGAALEYRRCRGMRNGDNHIALVTKWDVHLNGNVTLPNFVRPSEAELNEVFNERFPTFWAELRKSDIGDSKAKILSSCYCASIIDGDTVHDVAKKDERRLNFHKRKTWNQLYMIQTGKHLFADLQPPKLGILDKLQKWLKG